MARGNKGQGNPHVETAEQAAAGIVKSEKFMEELLAKGPKKQKFQEARLAREKWDVIKTHLARDKSLGPEIYALLKKFHRDHGFSLTDNDIAELKLACFGNFGYDDLSLAGIIVAVVIFDPEHCENWFRALARSMDIGDKEDPVFINDIKGEYIRFGSYNFMPGFILGIWSAADELLKTQPDISKFEAYFCELIKDLIYNSSDLQSWSDKCIDRNTKFHGRLTNLLALFFKEPEDFEELENLRKIFQTKDDISAKAKLRHRREIFLCRCIVCIWAGIELQKTASKTSLSLLEKLTHLVWKHALPGVRLRQASELSQSYLDQAKSAEKHR